MADVTTKKPTFLWQVILLTLPVLVLAAVGLHSLHQDRINSHREAADRAKRLADALAAEITASLVPASADAQSPPNCAFQVNAGGQLLVPPPASPGLTPTPLLSSRLTPQQARAWRAAQALEVQQADGESVISAYREFLALQPPADFVANATYSLGLILVAKGDAAEALREFEEVVAKHPAATTESGLPLLAMASLKLLETQTNLPSPVRAAFVESLCSSLVRKPTLMTAALLREAGRWAVDSDTMMVHSRWSESWLEHERARALYAAAQSYLSETAHVAPGPASGSRAASSSIDKPGGTNYVSLAALAPRVFWFSMPQPKPATAPSPHDATAEENWLALRFQETPEGRWFRCRPESEVATELRTTVARGLAAMDYFAVETWVAGRTVIPITPPVRQATSGGGGHAANPLAMANRTDNGTEWLKVSVFLSQPALLYADQRSRRFWFGSLIAISAVAALTGLWANWRALQNQQRLSELKSTFVSSVSHELRTPVASVRLLVDSLENGTVSGPWKQRQYLRLISQECRRLSALIENILDFSRIEQGRKQFDFEPTDVLALAEQTVRIIEPYAAERRVALSLLVPSAPARDAFPLPLLDGRAIEQALLNLIDNAIKHSPEGQTVRVGVVLNGEEAASAPGGGTGRVVLWVEDCGGGIPLEEQEKIFERFYRRGSELRRETQGVGIGLSIVKHIVEAHGGRVAVRSAIGQGSRFAIELPMNHPQEDCSHAS